MAKRAKRKAAAPSRRARSSAGAGTKAQGRRTAASASPTARPGRSARPAKRTGGGRTTRTSAASKTAVGGRRTKKTTTAQSPAKAAAPRSRKKAAAAAKPRPKTAAPRSRKKTATAAKPRPKAAAPRSRKKAAAAAKPRPKTAAAAQARKKTVAARRAAIVSRSEGAESVETTAAASPTSERWIGPPAVAGPTDDVNRLDVERFSGAARTGRSELIEHLAEHTEADPSLTGGDIDANWESAYSTGDESPGGDNPTPGQDVVDELGRALGVQYEDNEELRGADKVIDRDHHRWEWDPASADDYQERSRTGKRSRT